LLVNVRRSGEGGVGKKDGAPPATVNEPRQTQPDGCGSTIFCPAGGADFEYRWAGPVMTGVNTTRFALLLTVESIFRPDLKRSAMGQSWQISQNGHALSDGAFSRQ
jgi:hypothetical protein